MFSKILFLFLFATAIIGCAKKVDFENPEIIQESISNNKNKVFSDYIQKTYAQFFNEYASFNQLKWNIKEGIDNKKICDDLGQCFVDKNYLFEDIAFTMDNSILFLNNKNKWQFNIPKDIKNYNYNKVKEYIDNILCYKTENILSDSAIKYSWKKNKVEFTDYLIKNKNFINNNENLIEACAFLTQLDLIKTIYYKNKIK